MHICLRLSRVTEYDQEERWLTMLPDFQRHREKLSWVSFVLLVSTAESSRDRKSYDLVTRAHHEYSLEPPTVKYDIHGPQRLKSIGQTGKEKGCLGIPQSTKYLPVIEVIKMVYN